MDNDKILASMERAAKHLEAKRKAKQATPNNDVGHLLHQHLMLILAEGLIVDIGG